jgi:Xaa-Pro aminopeptidase
MKITLDPAVYRERLDAIREELGRRNLDALYLSNPVDIFYSVGGCLVPTERPLALVVPRDKREEPLLLIPGLEIDHAREAVPLVKELETYFDYPGTTPPIAVFGEALKRRGYSSRRIGIDQAAAGGMGYIGVDIARYLPEATFVHAPDVLLGLRLRKSPEEINFLKESAAWGRRVLHMLLGAIQPGRLEIEVGMHVSTEATQLFLEEIGPDYLHVLAYGYGPAFAVFTSGAATAFPHPLPLNRRVHRGDTIICGVGATLGGYNSELERTMFVGPPSEKQVHYFELAREIQAYAAKALQPSRTASDAEKDIRDHIRKRGCLELVRHRTGHGIGLDIHEPPWIDVGDETVIEPGMVVSCEPGLYVPGFSGFRHSDTILITASGPENLTEAAPHDWASLTIPC